MEGSCSGSLDGLEDIQPIDLVRTRSSSTPSEELVELLHAALPRCSAAVAQRMQLEGISCVEDLAGLEREDLRELGLTMVERSRLRRAIAGGGAPTPAQARPLRRQPTPPGIPPLPPGTPGCRPGACFPRASKVATSRDDLMGLLGGSGQSSMMRSHGGGSLGIRTMMRTGSSSQLDTLEEQTDFWCSLVDAPAATQLRKEVEQVADRLRVHRDNADLTDLREQMLEKLFDLSPERLREVYDIVDRDSDGRIQKEELRRGLQMCEVSGLKEVALDKVLHYASTDESETLQLAEFERVLTRLKLAQLLGTSGQKVAPGERAMPFALADAGGSSLWVLDYNAQSAKATSLDGTCGLKSLQLPGATPSAKETKQGLHEFFFGHRGSTFPMRWVHLGFSDPDELSARDLTLLLALTVKYHLHPLSVEDVLTQCATQTERYGSHYFAAIEYFCLDGPDNGTRPVAVRGCHVTLFCAGPPHWDTVITVEQPDRSFAKGWPGDPALSSGATESTSGPGANASPGCAWRGNARWTDRLQKRLTAARSRSRERQADFLMYQIIDLCTDDLVRVTRAYLARLNWLEDQLRAADFERSHETKEWFDKEWLGEVATIRLQLAVVSRRLRGVQRLLRRLADDNDLSRVLAGYLHDVSDHVHEALEDAGHLMETCNVLRNSYEHAKDKEQERRHQELNRRQTDQDERMNRMLFILTMFTTLFTPLTFLCGVYGMNFVDLQGQPSIPELTWKKGYLYFWIITITWIVIFSVGMHWMWRHLAGSIRFDILGAYGLHTSRSCEVHPIPAQGTPNLETRATLGKPLFSQ